MGFFGKIWGGIKKAGKWIGGAAQKVGTAVGRGAKWVQQKVSPLIRTVGNVAKLIPHPIAQAIGGGADAATGLIDQYAPKIRKIAGRGANIVSDVGRAVEKGDVGAIKDHLTRGLKRANETNLYKRVGEKATELMERAKNSKQALSDAATSFRSATKRR